MLCWVWSNVAKWKTKTKTLETKCIRLKDNPCLPSHHSPTTHPHFHLRNEHSHRLSYGVKESVEKRDTTSGHLSLVCFFDAVTRTAIVYFFSSMIDFAHSVVCFPADGKRIVDRMAAVSCNILLSIEYYWSKIWKQSIKWIISIQQMQENKTYIRLNK